MAEIPTDLSNTDASNVARWPENMQFRSVNNAGRADEGMISRWAKDLDYSVTSSGSLNAYAATSNRTIAALTNNTVIAFTANFTNTGASTFAFNGLTTKPIKRPNGDAVIAGDIVSGQPVALVYKTSPEVWFLVSPPAEFIAPAELPGLGAPPARAYDDYVANSDIAAVIPFDDTIPQIGEGTEILSVAITLNEADSRVRLRFQGFGQCRLTADDFEHWIAALFITGTSNALSATIAPVLMTDENASMLFPTCLEFEHAPGTVGPHTYSIRVGASGSGTLRLNGTLSGRKFGGAAVSTLVAEEIYLPV